MASPQLIRTANRSVCSVRAPSGHAAAAAKKGDELASPHASSLPGQRARLPSFDHLLSAGEHGLWNVDTQRFRGFEVVTSLAYSRLEREARKRKMTIDGLLARLLETLGARKISMAPFSTTRSVNQPFCRRD
jgi:hypothetical protein